MAIEINVFNRPNVSRDQQLDYCIPTNEAFYELVLLMLELATSTHTKPGKCLFRFKVNLEPFQSFNYIPGEVQVLLKSIV